MPSRAAPPPALSRSDRPNQRLDKWLWHARIVRTRMTAADLVTAGRVRLNRVRVVKPGHDVTVGDVLTITLGLKVRVVRVLAFVDRRGSPSEASGLYEEVSGPPSQDPSP